MNVRIDEEIRSKSLMEQTMKSLENIRIAYDCDWPIEIILDKHTITKRYNRIFKLLIHIKYAKYQIEKRDFHMTHPNLLRKTKSYSDYKEKYE
jgi:Gamma tubulin complex component C-terminal